MQINNTAGVLNRPYTRDLGHGLYAASRTRPPARAWLGLALIGLIGLA